MHTTTSLFLALIAITSALGQGTLIGPATRNGDFEDGVASPWLGLDVEQDAAFASQGEWFAVLQGTNTPTVRALGFQGVPASPSSGLTFIVSFDARNATAGFDSVNVDVVARNIDGTFVTSSITPVLAPPLASAAWGTFQTRIQLPETWDGGSGSINIGFLFKKNLAVSGTTYVGYLDNVILQQIPEPFVFALCGLGACLWAAGLLHRRRNGFGK